MVRYRGSTGDTRRCLRILGVGSTVGLSSFFAERVLIHVDTELGAKDLLNQSDGLCFGFAWSVGRPDFHE